MDSCIQVCNRLVQSHCMEMSFFCIWNQTFHVFQCTGDFCLTMSFHDRHIDKKIDFFHAFADFQFQSAAVFHITLIFLGVIKFYIIILTETAISADFKGIRRTVSHPGSLQNHHILKSVFFQIFQNPGYDFRMCGASLGRIGWRHQIRFDPDHFMPVADQFCKITCCKQFLCHLFVFCPTLYKNLIFVHEMILLFF